LKGNLSAKVLVIGSGNIAQGYDQPHTGDIRTHVKGYLHYKAFFDLDTIFDINEVLVKQVAKKWGIPNYTNKFEDLSSQHFDVISICTPDDTHEYYLDKVLSMVPRVVFLEKPINITYKKAQRIFSKCIKNGILIIVNYSRIFLHDFRQIAEDFHHDRLGKVLSATIRYHKGFNHNGSHLFNLIVFLLSPTLKSTYITNAIVDYKESDPSLSGIIELESFGNKFYLNFEAFDEAIISMIELDIITENNRIIYTESKGSHLRFFNKEIYFDGIVIKEYVLASTTTINYNYAILNALNEIKNYLDNGDSSVVRKYSQLSLRDH
jgi:predicted dehydrogenase